MLAIKVNLLSIKKFINLDIKIRSHEIDYTLIKYNIIFINNHYRDFLILNF